MIAIIPQSGTALKMLLFVNKDVDFIIQSKRNHIAPVFQHKMVLYSCINFWFDFFVMVARPIPPDIRCFLFTPLFFWGSIPYELHTSYLIPIKIRAPLIFAPLIFAPLIFRATSDFAKIKGAQILIEIRYI